MIRRYSLDGVVWHDFDVLRLDIQTAGDVEPADLQIVVNHEGQVIDRVDRETGEVLDTQVASFADIHLYLMGY